MGLNYQLTSYLVILSQINQLSGYSFSDQPILVIRLSD